ncbi:MAG: LysE family translocator [Rhodocyclaceae bacterium]|nr:LysE family translocator [Rhodocyclaceae bacterium]
MPEVHTLLAFLAASMLITAAPGPDNLMVLSQSLSRGRAAGLGLALGCAAGCLTHTLWATLGVSAVVASSPTLFTALKLAGSAYLLWLGIAALGARGAHLAGSSARYPREPWGRYLRRGFLANAINPKVALFFLAFMPQFVDPAVGPTSLQMMVLGAVFVLQTIAIFGLFAVAAARLGELLSRHPGAGRWLDRIAGIVLIGLAARLALESRH